MNFFFCLGVFSVIKEEKADLGCQIALMGYEGGQRKKSGQGFC